MTEIVSEEEAYVFVFGGPDRDGPSAWVVGGDGSAHPVDPQWSSFVSDLGTAVGQLLGAGQSLPSAAACEEAARLAEATAQVLVSELKLPSSVTTLMYVSSDGYPWCGTRGAGGRPVHPHLVAHGE